MILTQCNIHSIISADKWIPLRPDIKCPVILVCRLPRVSLGRVPYPSSLSSNILGRVPLIPLFGRLIGFSNFSISGPSRFRSPRASILNFPPEIPQDCTGRAVDKSPATIRALPAATRYRFKTVSCGARPRNDTPRRLTHSSAAEDL